MFSVAVIVILSLVGFCAFFSIVLWCIYRKRKKKEDDVETAVDCLCCLFCDND
ncbi:hypothetical protein C0J52_21924 [Blattella germanica]|nr:hypothetical protein C0J52_21924 [Blattella germanica]